MATEEIIKFFESVERRLDEAHRELAGALFTMAVGRRTMKDGTVEPALITGRVLFLDEGQSARESLIYAGLDLVEEWVPGQAAARTKLFELMNGGAHVVDQLIRFRFGSSWPVRDLRYERSLSGWTEWEGQVRGAPGENSVAAPSGSIAEFGKPAFLDGKEAARLWVWPRIESSDVPHNEEIVVVIPETRGRISELTWATSGDEVMVCTELNADISEFELRLIFTGAGQRSEQLIARVEPVTLVPVFDGTEAVYAMLIHKAVGLVSKLSLSAWSRRATQEENSDSELTQFEEELRRGESQEVEYKPFVTPQTPKEREILESCLAFANTGGGRVYVGVRDDGAVQGLDALNRVFGAKRAEGVNARDVLVERLRKLITDELKPVPRFHVQMLEVSEAPVAVIVVEKGENPPYLTRDNHLFVRHGASNMRPSRAELKDLLAELRSLAPDRVSDVWSGYNNSLLGKLI